MDSKSGLAAALIALSLTSPAAAASTNPAYPQQLFEALRSADLRLATIAYRLTTKNAPLCDRLQPELGIQFHSLRQYTPAARASAEAAFGFATVVTVEAVVADSPAAAAGVMADDGVLSVDDQPLPALRAGAGDPATTVDRDAIDRRIAALPVDRPISLLVSRRGQTLKLELFPRPGCRSRFEVHAIDEAAADGSIVQIGASFLDRFDDDALAVVVAHELSHIILRHRDRLEAAGVKYGILADFGKNGRLHGVAESEADLLSVYLLANANYDPLIAGRFWRGAGRRLDPGLFRSRAYLGWKARAAALDAEAAKIPAGAALPFVPPMIVQRDAVMK